MGVGSLCVLQRGPTTKALTRQCPESRGAGLPGSRGVSFCFWTEALFLPSPFPSARRQNQGSDGASMPGSFPATQEGHPSQVSRVQASGPERAPGPRPAFPAEASLLRPP